MEELTIRLTKVEYGDCQAEVSFELQEGALGLYMLSSETVEYPQGWTPNQVELQAYKQLADHLTGFAREAQDVVSQLNREANAT